jgi:hypothetical protein
VAASVVVAVAASVVVTVVASVAAFAAAAFVAFEVLVPFVEVFDLRAECATACWWQTELLLPDWTGGALLQKVLHCYSYLNINLY